MKKGAIIIATILLAITPISCKKKGCTDPLATNYQSEAEKDDGSCVLAADLPAIEITEDITVPTTFENKKYTICADINVTSELTIMPGAIIIMCANTSINVTVDGFIKAIGTADLPIVFKGKTESKGFWVGMAIKSTNPNNIFSYVTVKDAGTYWAWEEATVFLSGSLAMDHSTISNSNNIGLYITDGASISSFTNNTFGNCTTGLNLLPSQVKHLDGTSNFNNNNTNNFIYVRDGDLTTDAIWKKINTPLLHDGIRCQAGLTLQPGIILQAESDQGIDVKSSGYLNCLGTVSDPIVFKGRYSSAGYWKGIKINSNNPNNKFKHVQIQDGGSYWAWEYVNIFILNGKLELDNTTVTISNSYGLFVSSSQVITSGSVQTLSSGVLANNTFMNNGTGANANCTAGCSIFFE